MDLTKLLFLQKFEDGKGDAAIPCRRIPEARQRVMKSSETSFHEVPLFQALAQGFERLDWSKIALDMSERTYSIRVVLCPMLNNMANRTYDKFALSVT